VVIDGDPSARTEEVRRDEMVSQSLQRYSGVFFRSTLRYSLNRARANLAALENWKL